MSAMAIDFAALDVAANRLAPSAGVEVMTADGRGFHLHQLDDILRVRVALPRMYGEVTLNGRQARDVSAATEPLRHGIRRVAEEMRGAMLVSILNAEWWVDEPDDPQERDEFMQLLERASLRLMERVDAIRTAQRTAQDAVIR